MHGNGESERCTQSRCQSYCNKMKGKIKIKIKYMSTVYGDVPKPKSNLDLCRNPVGCARPRPSDA